MSTAQIPPPGTLPPEVASDAAQSARLQSPLHVTAEEVPSLLLHMQDELSRSRKREALWLSVILHLVIVMTLVNSDKLARLLPGYTIVAMSPADLTRQKDLTYLELPPDEQAVTKRPKTDVISDKDRIASSKKPQLDRQELKKILDASRPGRPGPQAPTGQQAPVSPPPGAQQAAAGSSPPTQDPAPNQTAQMQAPPAERPRPSFGGGLSAGSAIEQAARASVANRGGFSGGGNGGEYGLSQRGGFKAASGAEIITDTRGVDFGPYLARVKEVVKSNWYNIIPESARPPILKKGKVAIRFFIMKDGSVASMQWEGSSGDVSLDRAAWGAITASHPFPPLPKEFSGDYLGLRFHFYYNPDVGELQ